MNEELYESLSRKAAHMLTRDQLNPYNYNIYMKHLVKLVVQECANYINDRTQDWDADLRWIFNDGSGDMAVDVDNLLNRHFGVES